MERMVKVLLLTLFAAMCFARQASAQHELGFAFYDVDRLYDTLPSLFYNDKDYTPSGRYKWTSERYRRKVQAVAAVIDSMAMPVTVLYGVETEQTVRVIAALSGGYYSYIHRTLNTPDGMDFALLYYGDVLFPKRVEHGTGHLTVEAEAGGRDYTFILVRRAAYTAELVAGARRRTPEAFIIVAGDLRGADIKALNLTDATERLRRAGRGNVRYAEGWKMSCRILVDRRCEAEADIFVRRQLLDRRGVPLPTFDKAAYRGGAGGKLPIFCYIR